MFRKNSKKGDPQVEYQCTIRFLDDSEPIQLFFKVCSTQACNNMQKLCTHVQFIHYNTMSDMQGNKINYNWNHILTYSCLNFVNTTTIGKTKYIIKDSKAFWV